MKKYLLLLVIMACLCISACKGKEKKTDAAMAAAQEEIKQQTEAREENKGVKPEKSPGSIYFEADDLDNGITLVDSPEFKLSFRACRDLSEGYYDYEYEVIKKGSEKEIREIDLSNIYINGTELVGSEIIEGIGDDGGPVKAKRINGFIRVNDIDLVTSISGSARAIYMGGEPADDQYDFDEQVDSEGSGAYNLQPYMDALALTQNLMSDETLVIDLIGLGDFGGLSTSLMGILHITNNSSEDQIIAMSACAVNNICFEENDADICVKAGTDYYYNFYVSKYDITNAGIDSISSIGLLLLTDESENTAIQGEHIRGGRLYNVELYKKGNGGTPTINGNVIYDDNGIKAYVVGGEAQTHDGFPTDFYCYVMVENNTEENISVGYSDTKLNGVSCQKGGNSLRRADWSYSNGSNVGGIIPPGCYMRKSVWLYDKDNAVQVPCTVSFKMDFTTAGGGELLFRSDEISIDYTE